MTGRKVRPLYYKMCTSTKYDCIYRYCSSRPLSHFKPSVEATQILPPTLLITQLDNSIFPKGGRNIL